MGFAVLHSCVVKIPRPRCWRPTVNTSVADFLPVIVRFWFWNSVGPCDLELWLVCPKMGSSVKHARGNIFTKFMVSMSSRLVLTLWAWRTDRLTDGIHSVILPICGEAYRPINMVKVVTWHQSVKTFKFSRKVSKPGRPVKKCTDTQMSRPESHCYDLGRSRASSCQQGRMASLATVEVWPKCVFDTTTPDE